MLWALDAFENGFYLVYDMSARVEHYHYETYKHTYERTLTELYFEYLNFNYIRPYQLKFQNLLLILYRNFRYNASIRWIPHNWLILIAKYKAYRDMSKAIKTNSHDALYSRKIKSIPIGNLKYTPQ